uniref:gliding motility protein GldC n=1 Tax=Flavobacterium sp. TaxID=239 RepID=UPI00404A0DEE
MSHQSEINIKVQLDENRIPEKINWSAPDGGVDSEASNAFLLAVWDSKTKESLRIDLWTKEMTVDEMKIFFHQTLLTMTDTYQRATEDATMAETMRDFCDYFAEKLNLKKG